MSNQNTIDFILDKVAPIFNRQGYVGTSLSDLTEATKLTKGAIYCNFKNKEDLALQAFKLNARRVLTPLRSILKSDRKGMDKLKAIVTYHRGYFPMVMKIGGCPILNVGIDAKNNNPKLFEMAKQVSLRLISDLELIINEGIQDESIKKGVDANLYAKNIYSVIDGGVFMTTTHEDDSYINNVLDYLESTLLVEIENS